MQSRYGQVKNGSLLRYFKTFPGQFFKLFFGIRDFIEATFFFFSFKRLFLLTLSYTVSIRKVTKQNRLNCCDTVPLKESFNSCGIRFIS